MERPRIVTRGEWLDERKALLEQEKAFTRERDRLAAARRALPMVEVADDYRFQSTDGEKSLADLFGPHSQLIVQHFMFGENWEEGCPSCSFWVDSFSGNSAHLAARDTAFVLVSNAPLEKLQAYRNRLGWDVRWVSAQGSTFSADFGVTFIEGDDRDRVYNYTDEPYGEENPGMSVFVKLADGKVCHTYSTYARGLDILNSAYNLLDLTPKGRDEDGMDFTMAWLRRRDEY